MELCTSVLFYQFINNFFRETSNGRRDVCLETITEEAGEHPVSEFHPNVTSDYFHDKPNSEKETSQISGNEQNDIDTVYGNQENDNRLVDCTF